MTIRNATFILCLLMALPVFSKVKIKVKSTAPQATYAASRLEAFSSGPLGDDRRRFHSEAEKERFQALQSRNAWKGYG